MTEVRPERLRPASAGVTRIATPFAALNADPRSWSTCSESGAVDACRIDALGRTAELAR